MKVDANQGFEGTRSPHSLTLDELGDFWVSPFSQWKALKWQFENETPGSKPSISTVNWDIELPDGQRLASTRNHHLLHWLRWLIWTLVYEPADGVGWKTGTLGGVSSGLLNFVRWMSARSYELPSELDADALGELISDLPELLRDDVETQNEISISTVSRVVSIPIYAWRQRKALERAGIQPLPERPFNGRKANAISKEIATKAAGWIKPLPDEVAIPILNKAVWFLGGPAEDIIRLQAECLAAFAGDQEEIQKTGVGYSLSAGFVRQRSAAESFEFSVLSGENGPWHPTIIPEKRYESRVEVVQQVRRLVLALRDACVITIQAAGGMRISELCGLPPGVDKKSGLPRCVHVESSLNGLSEVFVVTTLLSKTVKTPQNVDWVVGMRPLGTTETPLAVRALETLDRLMLPYRHLTKLNTLLVSFSKPTGLPKTKDSIGPIYSDNLRMSLKDWVSEWVDLSMLPNESARKIEDDDLVAWRESKGRILQTHQFRKMWASFALSVDPRLLPVIQMQFHHLSAAMTEGGYIGNNLLQVEQLNSIARQQTHMTMFEIATGKSRVAGRMGAQIDENIGELKQRIRGKSTYAAWTETIRFCDEHDLRLWFSPYGGCLPMANLEMQCHRNAGTESWLNREPNYEWRESSTCVGCACFLLSGRHQGFWEARYLQNWASYKQAERDGREGMFRVVRARANQAGALLRNLGVNLVQLRMSRNVV